MPLRPCAWDGAGPNFFRRYPLLDLLLLNADIFNNYLLELAVGYSTIFKDVNISIKNSMRKTKTLVFVWAGLLSFFGLTGGVGSAAGSASFSIAGGSFAIGSTFQVPIYEASGVAAVNVVEADLSYNPSYLQLVSIDTSSSSFGGSVKANDNNGDVQIARYVTPVGSTISGQAQVATLNFKALAGSGSSQISFSPSSHIYSNGQDIWDKNSAAASYSFIPQAAPTAPTNPANKPVAQPANIKPQTAPIKPITDSARVLATTAKLPPKKIVAPPYNDNSRGWWAFIGLCGLVVVGLTARLFNLHKKIRAKSAGSLVLQVLKKAA
jgi:hypothetical protein